MNFDLFSFLVGGCVGTGICVIAFVLIILSENTNQ